MSHIQSHHGGTEEAHNTFLVILKVHGDAIQLWPNDKMQRIIGKTHSFRITCHNVDTHSDHPGSDIQVFVISDPEPMLDDCKFQCQPTHGEPIAPNDLAIFMTGPVSSSRKATYAIDVAICKFNTSNEDLSNTTTTNTNHINNNTSNSNLHNTNDDNDNYELVGAAYLYLDPKFSSQGIQRTPIISKHNHTPIGQMQVDYLIVTNPVGFGQVPPKPDWLIKRNKLDAGHRGAGSGRRMDLPDELLENTIDSFNYAHRHGADMCELDILVTADGVPVVYHDFDVDAVAAQQSSDELGKFRVQVNQFTVKQLRDFRLLALHDGEGCPYTLNIPNQAESNRPFPTLAEVLDGVDETCGLNIEVKWPQLLESGKMEAKRFREINDFVDRIINVVEKHARNRRIVLESFDADLTTMLRLKQNKFPVIFLSQGMTDRYERYVDIRARSIWNGIYFAQAFDLAGIDIILDYYMKLGKKLVDFINHHDLVARAWGDLDWSQGQVGKANNHMDDQENDDDEENMQSRATSADTLEHLKGLGVQCITYDRIDQIKAATTTPEPIVASKTTTTTQAPSSIISHNKLISKSSDNCEKQQQQQPPPPPPNPTSSMAVVCGFY